MAKLRSFSQGLRYGQFDDEDVMIDEQGERWVKTQALYVLHRSYQRFTEEDMIAAMRAELDFQGRNRFRIYQEGDVSWANCPIIR